MGRGSPRRSRTKEWVRRQAADPHVRRARSEGYRSRAAYKLIELDRRLSIFRKGMRVLDLGAAPGGWSQVAAERVGKDGFVLALDRLPMGDLAGVRFEALDLDRPGIGEEILGLAGGVPFDLVLSDMAPNITGVRDVDDAGFVSLAMRVSEVHARALRAGGAALTKVFQGGALAPVLERQRGQFRSVATVRPGATRKASREVYLWARGGAQAAAKETG